MADAFRRVSDELQEHRCASRCERARRAPAGFRPFGRQTIQGALNPVYAVFAPQPRAFQLITRTTVWYEDSEPGRADRRLSLECLFHAGLARNCLSGDWIENRDQPGQVVARRARCADLVIAGQPDPNDPEPYAAKHFVETLVMTLGRPMLLPHACAFAKVEDNVLLAWDASREASSAAYGALPFLQRAKQVTVVSVNAVTDRIVGSHLPGADIASTLARHDVRVTVRDIDELLTEAKQTGASLLVKAAAPMRGGRKSCWAGTRTLLRSDNPLFSCRIEQSS
ncbi:universal stress protein [Caballeronia grimmiae]|uniref:universal stress protein n=1 Tax=Caballeronia grimmiae TaxID=1071679 RepID=UPI0038BB2F53